MSAIPALQVALDLAIQGDSVLSGRLRGEKVYSLTAPADDSALPYIILGQSVETADRLFGSRGYLGIETIDIWTADPTKFEAAELANELERLLDETTLSVAGKFFCSGSLEIIAISRDPSGKYSHATCHYNILTYA